MSPHHSLKRFIRSSKPDHLTEEQRERIAAKRIAKFSRPAGQHAHQRPTPEQMEARDRARLKALQKRKGRD